MTLPIAAEESPAPGIERVRRASRSNRGVEDQRDPADAHRPLAFPSARRLVGALSSVLALAIAVAPGDVRAANKPAGKAKVPVRSYQPPSAPMPSLPVVARVLLEVGRDHVVVVHDVVVARGDYRGGDMAYFVAFDAPAAPRAFDARIYQGALDGRLPEGDAVGEALTTENAPRRPSWALGLFGPDTMSGSVVSVKEPAFRRATAANDYAVLRIRSLLDLPAEDALGGREVVVRLGTALGMPLTLSRIEVRSHEARVGFVTASAQYCGDEADGFPLAVRTDGRPPASGTAAPPLVRRHPKDDLCVRLRLARGA